MTGSPERMVEAFTTGKPVSSLIVKSQAFQRYTLRDSRYFRNSAAFAENVVKNDMNYMKLVLFDHG